MRRASPVVAWITLAAFAATGTGCIHTRIARLESDHGPQLAVSFEVFARPADRKAGSPTIPGVESELQLKRDGRWYLVYRSQQGSWDLAGLVPGEYRIVTERRYDPESGEIESIRGDTHHSFRLRPGERVEIRVALEKTPVGLIVVLSVTIVALIVVAILLAESGDLDLPDPGDFPVPPLFDLPPVFVPALPDPWLAGIYLDVGPLYVPGPPLAAATGEREPGPPAPYIQDYEPRAGERDVPPGAEIRLEFSESMDGRSFDPRNLRLETDGRALLAGIYYDDAGQRLLVAPLAPLPAGAEVRVTVLATGIESRAGAPLPYSYGWTFATAPAAP